MDKELVFEVKKACTSVKERIERLMRLTNNTNDNEFNKLLSKVNNIELNVREDNALVLRDELIGIQSEVDDMFFNSSSRKM